MNNSQTAFKARAQLERFLGIFSPHFSKPELRFLGQMLYGLQAAKDIKLSCIGRELHEAIAPKKTEERLSRNIAREGLAEAVSACVAREAAKHVGKDTLIVVDPTDIRKLYARKMPCLDCIRDGSKKELGHGYWACAAVACESGGRRVVPLHLRLWSTLAPGFKSENDEIFQTIETVRQGVKKRGIWVVDRGGDRIELFNHFLDNGLRFVVRQVGNRNLLWRNRPVLADKLTGKCRMRYAETITHETAEGEKVYRIEYGVLDVRLPDRPEEKMRMVVVTGFGEKPMMLLTNLAVTDSRESLWQVVEGYLSRWRIEDAIRYIKQSYRLEDIRLLEYGRLRNMLAVLLAAVYFASAWLGESVRRSILVRNITRVSKRMFGVVEFHYYAIADGIAMLFRRFGAWQGRVAGNGDPEGDAQLELPLFQSG